MGCFGQAMRDQCGQPIWEVNPVGFQMGPANLKTYIHWFFMFCFWVSPYRCVHIGSVLDQEVYQEGSQIIAPLENEVNHMCIVHHVKFNIM